MDLNEIHLQAASLRQAIRAHYFEPEADALARLLPLATTEPALAARIETRARDLVATLRKAAADDHGMQSFLREYDLGTQEGVLLMCVAEALLRIPDADTADRLIEDKLSRGDWDRHLGKSNSLLVNAGTWGMMLTGKLVSVDDASFADVSSWFGSLARRVSEPVVRTALRQGMRLMAEQFVVGRTIDEALERAAKPGFNHYRYSYDMLGEAALTAKDADRYFAAYRDAIASIARYVKPGVSVYAQPSLSVKLSALHPRYEHAQRERVQAELAPKLIDLALAAKAAGIGLTVDAEEADRLDLSLDLMQAVLAEPKLAGFDGVGLAVQAYQKRAAFVIDWLGYIAQATGHRIPVRLVKGAYWDTEIKRAQIAGAPGFPVYTRKANTDVSYMACAIKLLNASDRFYPMFATHNAHTAAFIVEQAQQRKLTDEHFELQRLFGMGDALHASVVENRIAASRVYAPVGSHEDLLPYLVRRLLENGANTSFVNLIADESAPIDALVADPAQVVAKEKHVSHPRIAMPDNLFKPERPNSKGLVFADLVRSEPFMAAMRTHLERADHLAVPLVAGERAQGSDVTVTNPATGRTIGHVFEATADTVNQAYAAAAQYAPPPVAERAALLNKLADAMERDMPRLMALLAIEAGKTLPDGVAEVREAVDFCRYYAAQAVQHFEKPVELPGPTGETNRLQYGPRGAFVCISPWNFPLAIFMGQVAAAFAAGNAVLAKPAEQTPLIAYEAIKLAIDCGFPKRAIALLPGRGETVGAALVGHAHCAGVAFTGSTDVAKIIHRTLAAKPGAIVPLIAETGGLNAMIADSSALPEQLVNDAIGSAFTSAGQRCSALRVLCVQEEIMPRVCHLLAGAAAELKLGDPAKLETDVGPVIDGEALERLQKHIARMQREAKLICRAPLPAAIGGTFLAPCAFEVKSIAQIGGEVFGPILHVLPYRAEALDELIDSINATGYGLTLGIASRIDATIDHIVNRAHAGNIYVNRNQIGAVVGSQPFGGEGLSGTGPKAGGPNYLIRFAGERVVTVNTAAAGGNAALMAQGE